MVIVFGLPGSGKTYFARHLAAHIDATHLSSDAVRKQSDLMGQYDQQSKLNVYDTLAEMATIELRSGHVVVIDATFFKEDIRKRFKRLASDLNQKLKFIEVAAEESTIRDRVSKDREDSEAGFEVYREIKREFEPYSGDHLVLKSDENGIEQMLDRSLVYLEITHG